MGRLLVAVDRHFGVWRRLYCLDVSESLKRVWESDDAAFNKYTALVATETRVLAMTLDSEFILFDATADEFKELGRLKALPGEKGLFSHPAFVGNRVYVRGSSTLSCFDFGG